MGDTYTRQSSYTDGDVITAAHTNDEFNQILAAFASGTGHTHDGTTGEGGPITKMLGTSLTLGDGTAGTDITVTFDGETADGVLKWMEDEDYFEFSDDILIASTEKLQFRDTAIYINSSADGQLDIVADTEVQIAATTVDINGAVDVSGNLDIGGNLTVTGTTTFNGGTLTLGDSASDNVVFGADVDSSIIPDDDDTYDLGSSSQQWRNLYVDGTAYVDTLDLNGTAITSTAAELNIIDGGTAASSVTIVDADRLILNDDGTMKQVAVTSLAAYLDDEITAMPNLVTTAATTVGALNSGSITSGFGTINTGSSTITTTGLITGGSLDIDDVVINGSTIGHTDDTDLMTLSSGILTVAGEVDAVSLDISGDVDIDGTLEADAITVNGTALATVIAGTTVTTATNANHVSVADNENTNEENLIPFIEDASATGNVGLESDGDFAYNPSTGTVSATIFKGNIDAVDGDFDGTLEADAITVGGVALAEVISDTAGAMFSSNTESGVTVTYQDGDNTIDVAIDAAQTGITSLLATDIKIGEDDETKIDFETVNEIHFYAANAEQVYVADGIFGPQTDSDVDLGSDSVRWKDAYIDTVTTTGAVTVGGNLTVNGTTTTVNSTTITVDDPVFTLGGDTAPGSDDNKDRGIEFRYHNGSAAKVGFFGFDDSAGKFTFIPDASNSSEVFSGTAGTIVANLEGAVTGNVTGNVSGTAATVTGAAQSNITSLGTLTTLTVDNVIVNGTTIGHTDDTDLMTLADGVVTVAGEVSMTTLDIGGTNVTSTAAELNIIDGDTSATGTTLVDADRFVTNDNGTMKQVALSDVKTYLNTAGYVTDDPTALAIALG
jgi:cytoskeletal protein CcmA (bactofilin family)